MTTTRSTETAPDGASPPPGGEPPGAFDTLWENGPRLLPAGPAFPLSTDSVLLGDFAASVRGKALLDLGCGGGVLTVLLGVSHPGASLHAVELLPEAAERCRENLRLNGLSDAGVITGDLRSYRSWWRAGSFDLAVSNPPYFPAGSGLSAPVPARAQAREERSLTLDELCAAAGWLLRWGGAFALVHRPERLSELCCAMTAAGIEPKRLRLVQHRADAAPNLILMEGRRGGRPGLRLEPPLILTGPDGGDSPEVRRIYHRKGA
ncbi:MAG: methyltransferase [Oscillospiraceae bacterium]|nr:methyltransferase [Oscillospiraceae bacterium]